MVDFMIKEAPFSGEAVVASEATILVVADSGWEEEKIHDQLENSGCQILVAFNGLQALEMYLDHGPDLVVIGAALNQSQGCQRLHREAGYDGVPVILEARLGLELRLAVAEVLQQLWGGKTPRVAVVKKRPAMLERVRRTALAKAVGV
jgi:chemotaxis response regulator CheB